MDNRGKCQKILKKEEVRGKWLNEANDKGAEWWFDEIKSDE